MEAINGKQEQKRADLIAAHLEEVRARAQLRREQEERRQAELMRQLEEKQEQRAIAKAALGSFLQGFISAYSSSLPAIKPAVLLPHGPAEAAVLMPKDAKHQGSESYYPSSTHQMPGL